MNDIYEITKRNLDNKWVLWKKVKDPFYDHLKQAREYLDEIWVPVGVCPTEQKAKGLEWYLTNKKYVTET